MDDERCWVCPECHWTEWCDSIYYEVYCQGEQHRDAEPPMNCVEYVPASQSAGAVEECATLRAAADILQGADRDAGGAPTCRHRGAGAVTAIVVCGSRTWTDPEPIRARLATLPANVVVVHGDARGADRLAGTIAQELGLHVAYVPALWDRHGRAAGAMRNKAMLSLRPCQVLAFWDGVSRGTKMMIELANEDGIPVEIISSR